MIAFLLIYMIVGNVSLPIVPIKESPFAKMASLTWRKIISAAISFS